MQSYENSPFRKGKPETGNAFFHLRMPSLRTL